MVAQEEPQRLPAAIVIVVIILAIACI